MARAGKTNPNRNNRARSPRFRRPPLGVRKPSGATCAGHVCQTAGAGQPDRQTPNVCRDVELRGFPLWMPAGCEGRNVRAILPTGSLSVMAILP